MKTEPKKEPTPEGLFLDDLRTIFADDLAQTDRARQIYGALCNHRWKNSQGSVAYTWRSAGALIASLRNELLEPVDDPDRCQHCRQDRDDHIIEEKKFQSPLLGDGEYIRTRAYLCDFSGEKHWTPGYQGQEDYLDYYCNGSEGKIASWVEKKLNQAGWQAVDIADY